MMIKKYTSAKVTIYWIVCAISIGLISGIIANDNTSGGEQKLFIYIAHSVAITLIGVILINISTLIFLPAQSIKNRLFSVCFIVISLILLYPFLKGVVGTQYDTVEKTRYIGPDEINIKLEYYPSNDTSRIIRSESFWKNGKKDSVWTIYERNGNIIKQKKYKNDQLVE